MYPALKKLKACFVATCLLLFACCLLPATGLCQLKWVNVDSLFQPLPASVHVYTTTATIDEKPNIAYYVSAELKDKSLDFTADTSLKRRLTPSQYFQRNENPLLVVNCTFFEFVQSRNLNVVIKNGKLLGYNNGSIPGRGKDTFTYRHPFGSAIGISKKRTADVAWLLTDSAKKFAYATQHPIGAIKDSIVKPSFDYLDEKTSVMPSPHSGKLVSGFRKWKMQTAVGGGPVLVQNGNIKISNNEELKFAGKAIGDKHPRTAMGYTGDGRVIVLCIQGRFPGIAEGATLTQEAQILKDLGCEEALNLDGGGSSCLLVNGKETIAPSDKVQRPVPAVFIIKQKK
ncbi:MAG: phosphodiester glycosidase family protein [Bacteroidota bacterium]